MIRSRGIHRRGAGRDALGSHPASQGGRCRAAAEDDKDDGDETADDSEEQGRGIPFSKGTEPEETKDREANAAKGEADYNADPSAGAESGGCRVGLHGMMAPFIECRTVSAK